MTKKQKKTLTRIIISAVLTITLHFVPSHGIVRFLLWLIPYLIIGYDILKKAFLGILNKQIFDENFLMAIATVGAFIIALTRTGDYVEAVAVMLFYQTGELFQSYAVGKSRKSIASLMDIRPDYANIETDGRLVKAIPDEVEIGSIIIVQPGEKIPIDGVVTDGTSTLNTSALTGESMPTDVTCGDSVKSGCINMSGVLKIKTTKEFGESTASKILELVENAGANKSKSENFISKFARIYTPSVCICALMLAVIPPFFSSAGFLTWLYRALTFLVVSCPCALVISIPLTFFAGIGGASRDGILIKGANYLETLAKTQYVVFDKTGTLTKGSFEVTEIISNELPEKKLIEYAALAESASSHPISKSIIKAYGKEPDRSRVTDICEIAGNGVTAKIDGESVYVGNYRLMDKLGIEYKAADSPGTTVHIAVNNKYCGCIVISDIVKESAESAISMLKNQGIKKVVMLTGDSHPAAEHIAHKTGIDKFYSELLPQDKVTKVEGILKQLPNGKKLAFVGDGINDAPVLSRADVGIAMGAIGSDAAIEAADVVIMDDNPQKISGAIKISKKVLGIVYQNCIFSIGIKLLCLILTALGLSDMSLAIFADVGVMVLAVLNATRALKL